MDSCWERNNITAVVTCIHTHIKIALKSTANSNNREMSMQQRRRSWARNGANKMMSTRRCNKDDEHTKAQQRWWARKGTIAMSAWWCINKDEHVMAQQRWACNGALMKICAPWRNTEYDDMHTAAAIMTCMRRQYLMIARWRKMKIGARRRNNKDWCAMAQQWRSACNGPKMNNNTLSKQPWRRNFKQSMRPRWLDNKLESATLMAWRYFLVRDLSSTMMNWVRNLDGVTLNQAHDYNNVRIVFSAHSQQCNDKL